MAALLVGLAIMGVLMSVVLPVWSHAAKREREAELIFRGEQYTRAIELYQRQFVGAYPPDLDTLVDQRFLRRLSSVISILFISTTLKTEVVHRQMRTTDDGTAPYMTLMETLFKPMKESISK